MYFSIFKVLTSPAEKIAILFSFFKKTIFKFFSNLMY